MSLLMNEEKNDIGSNSEFENFKDFVRRILKVPKSALDESIRKERQQEREEHKDPLEEKKREKETGNN